ncbi:MAG: YicC family protein [Candidatus Aminicenantes bacterium]|nr:MAG: YicC family protein [Candidatus Aminicenantes bacterium]HHF42961.1 YicC family protein [Candidatus Aminicenantes bacterium]
MIRSMTGFAEKKFSGPSFSLKFTIRTLNHRFFDWSYRGEYIGEIENILRSLCQTKIYRGRVEVGLDLELYSPESWEVRLNVPLAQQIMRAMEDLSQRLGRDVHLSADRLISLPFILHIQRKNFSSKEIEFFKRCFLQVLNEVVKDREREGREIKKEIRRITREIQKGVNRLEKLKKRQPRLLRERLESRLKELGEEIDLAEEKVVEETAFIVQKYDLTEEIARLRFHLEYLKELLASRDKLPVGKKLDFIAQELYREANTISSKSQDISITRESLAIKHAVESLRQQVQNIE